MAYSAQEWEVVKAFYERGLSLAEITNRREVAIHDRKTISRKANQEGWIKGKKATLVENEIKAHQAVAEIATEKATLNATELSVHNTLVSEIEKDRSFFRKGNLIIGQQIIRKVQAGSLTISELKDSSIGFNKCQEGVLPVAAQAAVQINNNAGMSLQSLRGLNDNELETMERLLSKVVSEQ